MRSHQSDYVLTSIVLGLTIFGLVAISSASVVMSQSLFGENYYFLKHQLLYGLATGLVVFLVCRSIPYTWWQKAAMPFLLVSLLLLSAIFIPGWGIKHSGATRWLNVGLGSLQPFEFVKLAFILYLASLLSKKGETLAVIKQSLLPILIIMAAIGILVMCQPNFSALIIVSLIAAMMYFLAGLHIYFMLGAAALASILFYALIKINAYRMKRLTVFLHPETDPLGIGYQINQALLAIGSGGLFGLGLGHSIQKWKYLPEVIGDSIFAIIAEELGLAGAAVVVIAFMILAWRGFRVAKTAPSKFGCLLAGGITGWLFFQAFINISAISGLLPLTGMPLPFISYGGSALVAALAGAGILVNISKYTKT